MTALITPWEALGIPEPKPDNNQTQNEKSLTEMTFQEIAERRKYRDGVCDGINSVKHAISDGLRHGSPECGKVMRGF
ncbi:hypothetical protein F0M16_19465 [Vibrio cholerae]|uniref:Uncharacterized protein n=1 Tax=Vibrio cholerae TaxID=666 RepID=A0A5Q6PEA4_VIBCL|nr:hypothetical protein [Vibrio cholerae]KAA1253121.1 hypothetical protein F0M16_19465 [Vibrio cholerae]